jgi:S-DNA-T family DNA segregation ATPase FtsK/SpoIIIE
MEGEEQVAGPPFDQLVFEVPDLVTVLDRTRAGVQANLVAGSNDRTETERSVRDARALAEARAGSFAPDRPLLDRFSRAWNEYGESAKDLTVVVPPPTSTSEAEATWNEAAAQCSQRLEQFRVERGEHEARARRPFSRAGPPPTLAEDFWRDLWAMQAVIDALPELRSEQVEEEVTTASKRLQDAARARGVSRQTELASLLAEAEAEVGVAVGLLDPAGLAWSDLLDRQWSPARWIDPRTRIGSFDVTLPGTTFERVPCVIPFPAARSLMIEASTADRDRAVDLARSVTLRVLASTPPGRTEVTFIDPLAIGASIAEFLHLGDHEARLVDTRPRTSPAEIEARLAEHAAHLETVISKYLRGQFRSIEDYNRAAGEMAESLRLVAIFDFPTNFTQRAIELLVSIVENGPRCGVFSLVVAEPSQLPADEAGRSRLLASMDVIRVRGERASVDTLGGRLPLDVVTDGCPELRFDVAGAPRSAAAELLADIGAAARRTEDAAVDLEKTFQVLAGLLDGGLATRVPDLAPGAPHIIPSEPATWWSGTSAGTAVAPIGRTGAQDVASLFFSSTDIAGGALVVGLPRSGKTTSLHAAILSMCLLYSPDELELYLIDAKHGVEFNAYRSLPHARMVAINNEREFAVTVLQSLDREIQRRAELMKREAPGRTNLKEYRAATGARLPRVVVFIDEFHELFEEDDRLGHAAFDAFSNIVRQGPFAGVHLVLASQTLTAMPAMDRSTLMLLPTRVAFACNESDAHLVMGDDNTDTRFLEKTGEGILNANRGNPPDNQRFRGVYVDPDERSTLVEALSRRAVSEGLHRTPRVFDGDALARRETMHSRDFFAAAARPLRLRCLVGEALALESKLELTLRRDQDANLLVVATVDDDGLPDAGGIGIVHSALLAASAQVGRTIVIDFLSDEGQEGSLDLETLCGGLSIEYSRRRRAAAIIRELGALIAERTALDDYASAGVLLVVNGIGRAAELDPDAYESDDGGPPLASMLHGVLRDGPEVGVHAVVLAESASALDRRLGPGGLDRFGMRIAGRLRGDRERQAVMEHYRGVDVRGSQMVLFDRVTERRTKFQPYGPVSEAWLDLALLEQDLPADRPDEETVE